MFKKSYRLYGLESLIVGDHSPSFVVQKHRGTGDTVGFFCYVISDDQVVEASCD